MESKKGITLGDILDLLDVVRKSEETVHIMGGKNGQPLMSGPVCSPYWRDMERCEVDAIAAGDNNTLDVWLKEVET